MIHPSYVELMKVVNEGTDVGEEPVVNSRYSIVCATAKRARQIIDGKEPLIDYHEKDKPLSIAVKELYEGELRILNDDEAAEMAEQEKKVKEIIKQRREEAEALAKAQEKEEKEKAAEDDAEADPDAVSDEDSVDIDDAVDVDDASDDADDSSTDESDS
ncbi:MAG: DNA-directed RNA polymerase subunit omega [Lachnospiraceae bacterium]|jgi:DNA-directed RNA polymerase subunit omega|nr:DNA-directed RNA polymerase subunit omega [Lachnospiraceae bacterium]MDD7664649.1 DNA-directed RNA polymerase subunit omega [Lachnospiraceae bacterium]MDY4165640.1 DNA-directed RNA polymerase subunit omega [Lachnospiraceae bacterium]